MKCKDALLLLALWLTDCKGVLPLLALCFDEAQGCLAFACAVLGGVAGMFFPLHARSRLSLQTWYYHGTLRSLQNGTTTS